MRSARYGTMQVRATRLSCDRRRGMHKQDEMGMDKAGSFSSFVFCPARVGCVRFSLVSSLAASWQHVHSVSSILSFRFSLSVRLCLPLLWLSLDCFSVALTSSLHLSCYFFSHLMSVCLSSLSLFSLCCLSPRSRLTLRRLAVVPPFALCCLFPSSLVSLR